MDLLLLSTNSAIKIHLHILQHSPQAINSNILIKWYNFTLISLFQLTYCSVNKIKYVEQT